MTPGEEFLIFLTNLQNTSSAVNEKDGLLNGFGLFESSYCPIKVQIHTKGKMTKAYVQASLSVTMVKKYSV